MTEFIWPEPNTPEPYDLNDIHPDALPIGEVHPVDALGFEVLVPRRSRHDVPGEQVYWCWSCNRRVDNYNQPFCTREHRKQRAHFTRQRRAAQKRPVPLTRKRIAELHALRERLERARFDVNSAADGGARLSAWHDVEARLDELGVFLLLNLPQQPPVNRRMPRTGQDERPDNNA